MLPERLGMAILTPVGMRFGFYMLNNRYCHTLIEQTVEAKTKDGGQSDYLFSVDAALQNDRASTYVIDTPPPTVSGDLHMGHLLSYAHIDFIARYKRMIGKNVFFPIGYDDNGLPTLKLLEDLRKKDNSLSDVKDRDIISRYHDTFRSLFKSMGMSYDWSLEYSTSDCSDAAYASFIDLHDKGHVLSEEAPVFWDVVQQTAISQSDITDKEVDSEMHRIVFQGNDGSPHEVDTTRPEMLPSCMAVLYHPEDKRYTGQIPDTLRTPLFRISVPTIADHDVQPSKGTGLVMLCLYGDEQDVIWFNRHRTTITTATSGVGLINATGHLIPGYAMDHSKQSDIGLSPEFKRLAHYLPHDPGRSMTVSEARKYFVAELVAHELYKGPAQKIRHTVKISERSGAKVEMVCSKQLFCKTLGQDSDNIMGATKQINWYPEHARHQMIQWINSLRYNWCISRSRTYGIGIKHWVISAGQKKYNIIPKSDSLELTVPMRVCDVSEHAVWCSDGTVLKGEDIIVEGEYELHKTKDRFDTWFTSSLTPQINAGALCAEKSKLFDKKRFGHLSEDDRIKLFGKLFPADLRPQGHDIIRTWAFYTIFKASVHNNCPPWKDMMVSGWCLAHDKTKMSKSKGNALSPVSLLEKFGADALRYWAANARLGADTAYDENVISEGKRLAGKIWNAGRFIQSVGTTDGRSKTLEGLDIWIMVKLEETVGNYISLFEAYDYSNAIRIVEDFFWKQFCDNYIECVKHRAYGNNHEKTEVDSARHTLTLVFKCVLLLLAPILTFVAEVVYHELFGKNVHARGSLADILGAVDNIAQGSDAKQSVMESEHALEVLGLNRKARSNAGVSPKKPCKITVFSDRAVEGLPLQDLLSCLNAREHNIISRSEPASEGIEKLEGQNVDIAIQFIEGE